jgi:hypothetical protein
LQVRIIENRGEADLAGSDGFRSPNAGPPNAFQHPLDRLEQRLLACEFCNERVCRKPDFSLWHKGFTASIEVTY